MIPVRLVNLQHRHRIPRRRVLNLVARILKRFHIRDGEVSVTFVGEARMRTLNHRYHRRDRVTDVLAFDLRIAGQWRRHTLIAEVIIAPAVAARTAAAYEHTYAEELLTYVAHGLLHVLGFCDDTIAGRARMTRWQRTLVGA